MEDPKECCRVSKPLIPLKTLMFLMHGGLSALLPFMTLHMKDLGISASETSLILTVLPFVAAIGPPIGGTLADKIGNYRIVFAVTSLLSVGLHLWLFFSVPITPLDNVQVPFNMPIVLRCSQSIGVDMLWDDRYSPCGSLNYTNFMKPVLQANVTVSACQAMPRNEFESDICGAESIMSPNQAGLRISEALNMTGAVCGNRFQSARSNATATCLYQCPVAPGSMWTCKLTRELEPTYDSLSGGKNNSSPSGKQGWSDAYRAHVKILAIYSVLRLLSTTIMWTAMPILDALAVTMCKQYHGELGQQKMYSQLGFSLMPMASSALLDWATERNGFPDYGPVFYIFAVMQGLAAFVIFCTSVNSRLPASNLLRDVKKVISDRRVISFTFAVFCCGCGFGFNTSFLMWFMEVDLHSPKIMLGLSQTAGGLVGIPAMAFAGPLIRRFGHHQIFALSILLYSPRYLAMAYIPDGQAYWICVTQLLEAVSHSLMIVTAADYAGLLSPKYVASLQGIIFSAHYCFGKGAGSLVGGQIYHHFGSRAAFKSFAVAYAVLFVVYIFGHSFFVVRHRQKQDKLKAAADDGDLPANDQDLDTQQPLDFKGMTYQPVPSNDFEQRQIKHAAPESSSSDSNVDNPNKSSHPPPEYDGAVKFMDEENEGDEDLRADRHDATPADSSRDGRIHTRSITP